MFRAILISMIIFAALILAGCSGDSLVSTETAQPDNELVTKPAGPAGCPWNCEHLWFCSNSTISYHRPDWMDDLSDDLLLSELALPGTHETMSRYGGPILYCQSLSLDKQLDAGIRAFDIRLRHIEDVLAIHHKAYYQNAMFGGDVLDVFMEFLAEHPSETIVMRAQQTHTAENVTRTFGETFEWYMMGRKHVVWQGDPVTGFNVPPSLGDVRGKIVIIQEFIAKDSAGEPMMPFGIEYNSLKIQDNFNMLWDHGSFNNKWADIRSHISDAMMDPDPLAWYLNYTSGATGVHPVDVAHGIIIWLQFCDGMNKRTYYYLTSCYGGHCAPYLLKDQQHARTGIIMSDYPGPGLIDAIIAHNDLPRLLANNPPDADAGGPYVVDEGTMVVFDASASTDFENDPLEYRWDIDGDGVFETDWSSDPTTTWTWYDDYEGAAQVEVRDTDPINVDIDATAVTVVNVPPEVTIESVSSDIPGFILPGFSIEISGSFVDAGYLDTHTALWRFGDQTTLAGSLVETNDPPEATGTVVDEHIYDAPGVYEVQLEVTDDDGGLGIGVMNVHVLSVVEAIDFIDSYIQNLDDSAFKEQGHNRKVVLSKKLSVVSKMAEAGNRVAVVNKLRNDIRDKMDGSVDGSSNGDWIIEDSAQNELCYMIDELVDYIKRL